MERDPSGPWDGGGPGAGPPAPEPARGSALEVEVDIDLATECGRRNVQLRAEDNCVFDDSGAARRHSSSSSSSCSIVGGGRISLQGHGGDGVVQALVEPLLATGLAKASAKPHIMRRRSSRLSSLLGARETGTLYAIRRCLSWEWLGPVLVLALAMLAMLGGVSCAAGTVDLYSACPETLIPGALLLPLVYLCVVVYLSQPAQSSRLQAGFFSDALLEEMLAGDSILDVYTVTTRGWPMRDAGNVVVFLAGVGGVSDTWQPQVDAVVSAGFSAITIQLPGSGALGAVTFSMARAERVVRRVLEEENLVCAGRRCDSADSSGGISRDAAQAAEAIPADRKVVLVAWGLACHVAMFLASSRRLGNSSLAGVALFGSPQLPCTALPWYSQLRFRAFRVPWIAEGARVAEYTGVPTEVQRVASLDAFRPEARSDWGESFVERRDALEAACAEYVGPVLAVSGDHAYLLRVQQLWGQALSRPGSNVEAVHVRGLERARYRSYPRRHERLYSRHLVEFASSAFV